VTFLKKKHIKENMETALLSESSLQKDWFSAQEDPVFFLKQK
jgi:hypothetical protein